jgi:hypothetical protein
LVLGYQPQFIFNFVLSSKLGLSHGGKNGLRVFENWVFKRIFGCRRETVTLDGKKLHIEDHYNFTLRLMLLA